MKRTLTLSEQKEEEIRVVNTFIEYFKKEKVFSTVVYDEWTKKDVLAHIASWHISFANNLLSAVNNQKPNPFNGSLTAINEREVARLSPYTISELIELISNAQKIIEENIENTNVAEIAYKKGSRNYTPLEHLEIVARHIKTHLSDLMKKDQ